MRNSQFILHTLDDCLDRSLPVVLHLLGGGALDLVYGIQRFSEDIDVLCTMAEADAIDTQWFWQAVDVANERLAPHGLYLTHLFDEEALVHTPNWTKRLVPSPPEGPAFRHFQYDAVSPEDIIISKLTRFDEKDQADVRDLMRARGITKSDIDRLIDVVYIGDEWLESWEAGLRKWPDFQP